MSPTNDPQRDITAGPNGADAIIAMAKLQYGKPYQMGAEGPNTFDCSGLVDYCFRMTNQYSLIGSSRRRAQGYFNFFSNHKRIVGIHEAKVGDLAFYGSSISNVTHVGIVSGVNVSGHNYVISALVNPYGVTKTRLFGLLNENGNILPLVAFGSVDYATA